MKAWSLFLGIVLCARISPAQVTISLTNQAVRISVPSATNREYFFEEASSLTNWQRTGAFTNGTGATISWTKPITNHPGFYRVNSAPLVLHPLLGIDFSPYLNGQTPGSVAFLSASQIEQRMRPLIPYTDWIRTFGTTQGLEASGRIAHRLGFKTAIGAWLGPETNAAEIAANHSSISNLITMANAGEAELLIVGSEVLIRGDLTVPQLIAYINQVRAGTSGSGIPITTADGYGGWILPANTNLINACDIVMVNIYPFFEDVAYDVAPNRFFQEYLSVKIAANGKPVWISETGWPSAGDPRYSSVPSVPNAANYFARLVSWARSNDVPLFYFEGFDEAWKTGEGTFGPYWGIWDANANMKPGMQAIFDNQFYPANWNAIIGGSGTPSISLTSIPPTGSSDIYVSGTVNHVAPFDAYISLFIKVGGAWYEKPYSNALFTTVNPDGSWTTQYVTGGFDNTATTFAAYLFPKNYVPPHVIGPSTLPAELASHALASSTITR